LTYFERRKVGEIIGQKVRGGSRLRARFEFVEDTGELAKWTASSGVDLSFSLQNRVYTAWLEMRRPVTHAV
jgi:hypothetical protein